MQPGASGHIGPGRRIMITNHHLEVRAGSELVTLEVAGELHRRGNQVAVFTLHRGPIAEEFTSRTGIEVLTPLNRELVSAWAPDLIHVHHWPTLAYLRSVGVFAPAVIGFLGSLPDLENPPPFDVDSPMPWWAVSEKVEANVARHEGWNSASHLLVRNWFDDEMPRRQPVGASTIDSLVVVSNHFPPAMLATLKELCATSGVKVDHVGLPGNPADVDTDLLAGYDAVISLGRTAIQAMALGLPVLVLDHLGAEGWVTRDNVELLATENFSGRFRSIRPTPQMLADWLHNPPTLDDVLAAQDWVWQNCRFSHAVDQLQVLHDMALSQADLDGAQPWFRVVGQYLQQRADLGVQVQRLQSAHEIARASAHSLERDLAHAQSELERSRELVEDARRLVSERDATLNGVLGSLSWRVTSPMRGLSRAFRGGTSAP